MAGTKSSRCSGCLWSLACFNGNRTSRGLSFPPHKIWPLTPIPKARTVPTSALGRGEPLNSIPGVGDWGIRVWDRSRVQSHSPMWPPGGPSELHLG